MTTETLKHIAIIMDGNNRWAKQRGMLGTSGHKAGVERIRDVLAASKEHGIDIVTLFAFSSENWSRPPKEVEALMGLFLSYLKKEAKKLNAENVRVRVIGDRSRFSNRIQKAIADAEAIASTGERTLVIAADYGGKWDIANAAKAIAEQVAAGRITPDQVNESLMEQHVSLADVPPVDLLIRTGGDLRISNFLLWQCAYAEFYFTDVFWPDFNREQLQLAVDCFYTRQRRFGGRIDGDNDNSGIASA
ncbi:polyprenyl diphosphate synthase [Halioxenophilus aromaticivorans]|uniref:Ditrans,polycis-undecaprenyl-diphosphate synthase ((2E,6E)-farnesyl-diphosphate specific) n=1 Tax=Halioxenophilus aromaticivorans TaxID=1306992 RepID=A0AAV3TZL8_9ALTE